MTVVDLVRPSATQPGRSAGADRRTGPIRSGRPERLLQRGGLVALAVGAFLLPWCVLLSLTLPATMRAQNWSLAWVGLDGAEAAAALATAWLLARRDQRAGLTALAGGTLLVVDAWFDVCTAAPGADQMMAVAEALLVELPLAATAIWFAVRLTRGTW